MFFVVLAALLCVVTPSEAAIFSCASGDVPCLVSSIGKANSNGARQNTVRLPPGTWTLTTIDNSDTEGSTGLPVITSRLTIEGAGPDQTVIERAAASPLFRLVQVAPEGTLTVRALTLQGGAVDIDFLQRGGGIRSLGSLTLTETVLANNQAWVGGAVESRGSLACNRSAFTDNFADFVGAALTLIGSGVTIERCVFLDNIAQGEAGIAFDPGAGDIVIRKSLFSGNMATLSSGGGGGGVGTVLIEDSAFVDNTSALHGGALALDDGELTLRDTLVAGNRAEVSGGGLYLAQGTIHLDRATVVGNRATFGQGGGIRNGGGAVLIERSFLLDNQAPQDPDCSGAVSLRLGTILDRRTNCGVEGAPGEGASVAAR